MELEKQRIHSHMFLIVFRVYGIGVDHRHLGLIGDYMTYSGEYRAMNRISMSNSPSPLLKVKLCLQIEF